MRDAMLYAFAYMHMTYKVHWTGFLFLMIKEVSVLNCSCVNKIIHFKPFWYIQGRFLIIFI